MKKMMTKRSRKLMRRRRRKIRKTGMRLDFIDLFLVVLIVMMAGFLVMKSISLLHKSIMRMDTKAQMVLAPEQVYRKNADTIRWLAFDKWCGTSLSLNDRLRAGAAIVEVETSYLNLYFTPDIVTGSLVMPEVGNYNAETRTITINESFIQNCTGEDFIRIIAHECYHAQQQEAVKAFRSLPAQVQRLPMFDYVNGISQELLNYNDGREDEKAYRMQRCETDANEYADQRLSWYKSAGLFQR